MARPDHAFGKIDVPGFQIVVALIDLARDRLAALQVRRKVVAGGLITGVAVVSIGLERVDPDHHGVARFGAFNKERSGQRIAVSLGVADPLIVKPG
jgi:hypothetical protein